MASTTTKIPYRSLSRLFTLTPKPLSRTLCTATETREQKLERIADELLDFNKLERYDYAILSRLRMGLNKYGAALSGLGQSSASAGSMAGEAGEAKAAEKTAFDIKLEKFDAASKIKIIKEVRSFTDLGLKEAKELVEKAPVVLKKGLTKEVADSLVAKFKDLGATVVLE
ncbi:50S ribosomal protein L12, chloroplastic [Morella rubra]|uniref:50S ribosomal protein L12, chloroplastic n=1 Tax=Morella rubra TaxID=262757 RepID=A0A6A1VSA3_9ROSI|nr:50S ribosomal protein L12, chloroplastic [Morella rubra]